MSLGCDNHVIMGVFKPGIPFVTIITADNHIGIHLLEILWTRQEFMRGGEEIQNEDLLLTLPTWTMTIFGWT